MRCHYFSLPQATRQVSEIQCENKHLMFCALRMDFKQQKLQETTSLDSNPLHYITPLVINNTSLSTCF